MGRWSSGSSKGWAPGVTLVSPRSPTSMGGITYGEDLEEEKNSGACPRSGRGGAP